MKLIVYELEKATFRQKEKRQGRMRYILFEELLQENRKLSRWQTKKGTRMRGTMRHNNNYSKPEYCTHRSQEKEIGGSQRESREVSQTSSLIFERRKPDNLKKKDDEKVAMQENTKKDTRIAVICTKEI